MSSKKQWQAPQNSQQKHLLSTPVAGLSLGPRHRLQSYRAVESPVQCAQKKVQRSKASTTLRLDSAYSPDMTHSLKPVAPADSAEKTAEKKLVRQLAPDVDVGATHLEGKEHLLQLVQNGLLSEFDVQSCAM